MIAGNKLINLKILIYKPTLKYFTRFAVRDNDVSNAVILTKPHNLNETLKTLKLLPDVEIVKLCRLQSWWLQNYYPFTFPGQMRQGNLGAPAILKRCTAYNGRDREAQRLLRRYVSCFGATSLPRSVIIVLENGTRSHIPEEALTPTIQFNYQILPNDFLVTPAADSSGDDSSDDDSSNTTTAHIVPTQILSSDDDGSNDDNDDDDDDDDDAMQIGLQPCDNDDYLTQLTQEAREMLVAEFRYEPGSDRQGQ